MNAINYNIAALLLLAMVSCSTANGQGSSGADAPDPLIVSKISTTEEGKPFLEVDGKPFAVYGAQIRVDIFRSVDKLDWPSIEEYFALASKLGVNCVQVPCPWAFIEPKRDSWDFDAVDRILGFANRHDLKVELLWFSTNMIGDSYSWLVPTYILATPSVRLKREDDGSWHGLYGYTYSIAMDSDFVLERERNAVTRLFAHIREWDEANGNRHPVITCQIHNEPDALVRWRLAEKKISHRDGTMLTQKEAWDMTLKPLDIIGRAVKNSAYSVATRTNIISGDGVNDFPQTPGISPKDVYALEGIDFVSFDPYMAQVDKIAYEVSQYASMPGNYPLVAENRGDYSNTASLMLVASALGGGYDIYDLATSKYITSHSEPPFNSEGIYNSDFTPKAHVPSVKTLLSGLVAAGEDVALTATDDFAVFNVRTDNPQESLSQTMSTTGAELKFETSSGALAFVLDRGDRLVAFSTADAVLTVGGGSLSDGKGNAIALKGGQLTELGFRSAGERQSTVKQNIGTLFDRREQSE